MKNGMQTHLRDNNPESQRHLEENEEKFSGQCLMVWKLLNQGVRLTVVSAVGYGITSLPRRIKDLEDRNGKLGIIKNEWVMVNGKRSHKEWYVEIPKPPTKKEVIARNIGNLKQTELF